MTAADRFVSGRRWPAFLLLCFLLAALLRLVYPGDIEYKADEQYMFERSQEIGLSEPWPITGMPSGVLIENPGMSVWAFAVLAKIGSVTSPIGLARSVQILSLLALAWLILLTYTAIPKPDRERWRWAAAFVAVNPMAVLFHRKIWAQSILPIFSLLLLYGWWKRDRRWGAFLWGFVGVCIGQIHMSGFFFAAGFVLWGLLFSRREIRWRYWLTGSAIGFLPLIPWIMRLSRTSSGMTFDPSLIGFRSLRFWKHWATDSVGTRLDYSLGKHFDEFLRGPLIAGHSTHLLQVVHWIALVVGVVLLIQGIVWLIRGRSYPFTAALTGRSSFSSSSIVPSFLGMGIFLTLAHVPIHRHYMIVTFPLEFVWLAGLALIRPKWGRRALVLLWAIQLLISAQFLGYIHENGGAPRGDYGTVYQQQVPGD